jgi:serine/threonine protein kinase
MSLLVNKVFAMNNHIGRGSFGDIYDGEHIRDKYKVAIKMEPKNVPVPQLANEYTLYSKLEGCRKL